MKTLIIAGLFSALFASAISAQTTHNNNSTSSAQTASNANSQSAQANQQAASASLSISNPAATSDSVHYSGLDRGAPAVVTGGFAAGFSTDNCMNTSQGGISAPGWGAIFGKGVADDNCRIMRRIDAHIRTASGYAAMNMRAAALYQLDQAAQDNCIADGYDPASCRRVVGTHPSP